MNEQQTISICEAVELLFKGRDLNRLMNPDYFPKLVVDVRTHLRTDSEYTQFSEIEIYCLTAMSVLGPAGRGAPPVEMHKQFLQIVGEYASDQLERALEFAVAYGCGKWREAKTGDQGWTGLWSNAIEIMSLALVHAVREVNIWLGNIVPGYSKPSFWQGEEGRALISMDARYLALRLVNPVRSLHLNQGEEMQIQCTQDGAVYSMRAHVDNDEYIPAGSRLVFAFSGASELITQKESVTEDHRVLEPGAQMAVMVRDEEVRITFTPRINRVTLRPGERAVLRGPVNFERWGCGCGNQNCERRHRLVGWDPRVQVTLWSFLASAVKGLPKLVVKSFVAGCYYPLLAMEGSASGMRVRQAPVVKKVCPQPECSNPDSRKRFEGARCPFCKSAFDTGKVPRIKEELLIAVTDTGVYERIKMQHCSGGEDAHGRQVECDNYFTYSDDAECPLCGHIPKVRRPTYLWERNFSSRLYLCNDPDAIERFSTGEEPSLILESEESVRDLGKDQDPENVLNSYSQSVSNKAIENDD